MKRAFVSATLAVTAFLCAGISKAEAAGPDYAAFTASAHERAGLFPIWQKGGDTYLELASEF